MKPVFFLLLFFPGFCVNLDSFLQEKLKEKVYKKTGIRVKTVPKKQKFVALRSIEVDGKTRLGNTSLLNKSGHFYFTDSQIQTVFLLSWDPTSRLLKKTGVQKMLDFGFFADQPFLKSLSSEKTWKVRDIASLLGYKAVYDADKKILSFEKSKDSSLALSWKKWLLQTGNEVYRQKILKTIPKKPKSGNRIPKPSVDPQKQNFTFTDIYATSFEAQVIASEGKRGDFKMRSTDLGVALPAREALGKWVEIYYPKTQKSVVVEVIDVGPWNIDDPYWVRQGRPASESGKDEKGRKTNLAGIDFSYQTWVELGVERRKAFSGTHSGYVHWRFVQ